MRGVVLVVAALLTALVASIADGVWYPILGVLTGLAIGGGGVLSIWIVLNLFGMPFGTDRWLKRWPR